MIMISRLGMPVAKAFLMKLDQIYQNCEYCSTVCPDITDFVANNVDKIRVICEFSMVQTKLSIIFTLASVAPVAPPHSLSSGDASGSQYPQCVYVQ
jgi:hypothetical protein